MLKSGAKFLFIVGLSLSSFSLFAQTPTRGAGGNDIVAKKPEVQEVSSAIRNADIDKISKYMGEEVEISLPNKQGSYSKAQAKYVMKEFFTDYPPAAFTIVHTGSYNRSQYALGEYVSKNKKPSLEVNILYTGEAGNQKIDQIRIEQK